MIHTIETLHHADAAPAERVPRVWAAQIARIPYVAPAGIAKLAVQAEINHGRWLARCPACPGAELVSKNDPRFWCCSCQNDHVAGLWLNVQFPADADQIEALLELRPAAARSWCPDETVTDLADENFMFGIGI